MPDGQLMEPQQCGLPGCDETIVQPEIGGVPRLYCSHEHRSVARKLRSVARFEAGHVQDRIPPQERRSGGMPAWNTDPFSLGT